MRAAMWACACALIMSSVWWAPVQAQDRRDALGSAGPRLVQQQGATPRPRVTSPMIHADRRVTLSLLAPEAKDVRLTGQIIGDRAHFLSPQKYLPMTRDERGVWTITVGPLEPNIYEYSFSVDGVDTPDPGTREGSVEVPGAKPAYWDSQPVPHGSVRMEVYESKATGSSRYVWVYTPPGYDESRQRYPVLYLLHGGNCCEFNWVTQVRANIILDNMIAEGRARPMILVMPLGARFGPSDNLGPNPAQMEGALLQGGADQGNDKPGNRFEQDLLGQLAPFIDAKFRTIANADHRGLGGVSQGGLQTLTIGLRHTDVFRWLAPIAAGAENGGDDQLLVALKDVTDNPAPLRKNLKLLYFSVGVDDVLYEPNVRLVNRLRDAGVAASITGVPGRHQRTVWRRALYDVAPKLFK